MKKMPAIPLRLYHPWNKKENPSQEQIAKESEQTSKVADLVEPSMPEEGNKEIAEIEKINS